MLALHIMIFFFKLSKLLGGGGAKRYVCPPPPPHILISKGSIHVIRKPLEFYLDSIFILLSSNFIDNGVSCTDIDNKPKRGNGFFFLFFFYLTLDGT